ncbi:hypothetical protein PPERSA_11983 [Pseudocohnilembus persalinus]|uniref:PH domain-containing protein n=1 Tax=Pseudocohnilembus persalinus TaxID=266149 RepID=A0A0V0QK51_PSEPJ|nr:hypothetical protein PPERSA_11983 [Pseudocohnilembus persalinus]|eukprot:KRX02643.1 hypothetical protein PPERSA_11983 [Pseudocohnilembus persalinus]
MQRNLTGSDYDHVGIIMKFDDQQQVRIFDSTSSLGVGFFKWDEYLDYNDLYEQVAIRKLYYEKKLIDDELDNLYETSEDEEDLQNQSEQQCDENDQYSNGYCNQQNNQILEICKNDNQNEKDFSILNSKIEQQSDDENENLENQLEEIEQENLKFRESLSRKQYDNMQHHALILQQKINDFNKTLKSQNFNDLINKSFTKEDNEQKNNDNIEKEYTDEEQEENLYQIGQQNQSIYLTSEDEEASDQINNQQFSNQELYNYNKEKYLQKTYADNFYKPNKNNQNKNKNQNKKENQRGKQDDLQKSTQFNITQSQQFFSSLSQKVSQNLAKQKRDQQNSIEDFDNIENNYINSNHSNEKKGSLDLQNMEFIGNISFQCERKSLLRSRKYRNYEDNDSESENENQNLDKQIQDQSNKYQNKSLQKEQLNKDLECIFSEKISMKRVESEQVQQNIKTQDEINKEIEELIEEQKDEINLLQTKQNQQLQELPYQESISDSQSQSQNSLILNQLQSKQQHKLETQQSEPLHKIKSPEFNKKNQSEHNQRASITKNLVISKIVKKNAEQSLKFEGYLYKKSIGMFGGYKKRFFVLTDQKIYYFDNQNKQKMRGCINFRVSECEIIIKNKAQFIINLPTFKKQFMLKGENQKSANQWIDQIQEVIDQNSQDLKFYELHQKMANKYYENDSLTESQFKEEAETGDIILFETDNFGSRMQRKFTNSKFDHVGLVIKFSDVDVRIFDASVDQGVGLMDWDEFIDWNDLYSKVILRKLVYHKKLCCGPPFGKESECRQLDYQYDENLNDSKCINDCDCNGYRFCKNGKCQGTEKPDYLDCYDIEGYNGEFDGYFKKKELQANFDIMKIDVSQDV